MGPPPLLRPPSSLATVLVAMVWWATVDTSAMEWQLPHPWCTQWHTRSLTPSTLSPTLSASTISPRFPPTPTSTASTMTTPAPPSSRPSLTTAPATSPRSPTTAPPLTLTSSVLDTEWSAMLLPIPLPIPLPMPTPLLSDMASSVDTVLPDTALLDTVLSESNLNKFIYVFMFNKDINHK